MTARSTSIQRKTKETNIDLKLNLDGQRKVSVSTGLGFFDHMLTALAFHAGWNLNIQLTGDLHVDDHHTVEDCGIALGSALLKLVDAQTAVVRFGSRYAPLDESLARCVVDISGRPCATINLALQRESIGNVATENLTHFFQSFANAAKITLHLDVLRGANDHHRAEAAFKSMALALQDALKLSAEDQVPSTKGVL